MQQRQKPQTYEQWLSELKFAHEFDDVIKAANAVITIARDKKQAQVDVALTIVEKYKIDMRRAFNPMVKKTIEESYDTIAEKLFSPPGGPKCKMSGLIKYVQKNEPNFVKHAGIDEVNVRKDDTERNARGEIMEKKPLGFIKGYESVDREGQPRKPLGFVNPVPTIDKKDGKLRPPLGFLGGD